MHCPKCHAAMHTYNRNGVQIEQCSGCRGIFLDYGELEALTRLEGQWSGHQSPPVPPGTPQGYPAAPAPAWGAPHHGGHHEHHGHHGHKRHKSFGHMLFSS
ncbi:zf-TFIIB domain-containing protein [Streptomyces sp. MNP-20]|uniref:TFIIB-type zinc ribbon-containing protein n=1 Tax=Streptomyces sp. MNP-20 TaxID=2721165 RepID=UPI0015561033|nr:zf-TFIIB domain-containing protein [Streptomyces sp. MNP-20]